MVPPAATSGGRSCAAGHILAALDGPEARRRGRPDPPGAGQGGGRVRPRRLRLRQPRGLPPQALPQGMGLQDVKGLDYRWGFQDKETVSILRVAAPKPREGMLAILDQPTFDKSGLPPIPEGVDRLHRLLDEPPQDLRPGSSGSSRPIKPDAAGAAEALPSRSRRRRSSGSRRTSSPTSARRSPSTSPRRRSRATRRRPHPLPSPLLAMLGMPEVPRLTIVAEIDDPKAFGRTLDSLMIAANQGLRGLSPMLAAHRPARPERQRGAAPAAGRPAARRAASKSAATGRDHARIQAGRDRASTRWRMPPALAALVPSYVRPTIRIGPKHVVISVSPEAARAALEVKGARRPGSTFATTLQAVPGRPALPPGRRLDRRDRHRPGRVPDEAPGALRQGRRPPRPRHAARLGGPGGPPPGMATPARVPACRSPPMASRRAAGAGPADAGRPRRPGDARDARDARHAGRPAGRGRPRPRARGSSRSASTRPRSPPPRRSSPCCRRAVDGRLGRRRRDQVRHPRVVPRPAGDDLGQLARWPIDQAARGRREAKAKAAAAAPPRRPGGPGAAMPGGPGDARHARRARVPHARRPAVGRRPRRARPRGAGPVPRARSDRPDLPVGDRRASRAPAVGVPRASKSILPGRRHVASRRDGPRGKGPRRPCTARPPIAAGPPAAADG